MATSTSQYNLEKTLIADLNATQSAQKGLYRVAEVSYGWWEKRGWRSLPLPDVGVNRQIIIFEMYKGEAHRTTVLTHVEDRFEPQSKYCDQFRVVTVDMTPFLLNIDPKENVSPQQPKYLLSDAEKREIDVGCDVHFRITDAYRLLKTYIDPFKTLETRIKQETQNFLLHVPSDSLLVTPPDLQTSWQQYARDSGLPQLVEELTKVLKRIAIDGLELLDVKVTMQLPDALKEHLNTQVGEIFGTNGSTGSLRQIEAAQARIQHINALMDEVTTFAPYNLREVIIALDATLFQGFYAGSWLEAMVAVTTKFDEHKKKFEERQREKAKEKPNAPVSNQDFLVSLIGRPATNVRQITVSAATE